MREIQLATAVYVFTPDFEHLLFIRHRKGPIAGYWLPPGGHVDPGETPSAAAVREVFEETGQRVQLLNLSPLPVNHLSPRTEALPGPLLIQREDLGDHDHLDLVYVAVAPEPGPLRAEADQPAIWLKPEELGAYPILPDCLIHARYLFAEAAHYDRVYRAQSGDVVQNS